MHLKILQLYHLMHLKILQLYHLVHLKILHQHRQRRMDLCC